MIVEKKKIVIIGLILLVIGSLGVFMFISSPKQNLISSVLGIGEEESFSSQGLAVKTEKEEKLGNKTYIEDIRNKDSLETKGTSTKSFNSTNKTILIKDGATVIVDFDLYSGYNYMVGAGNKTRIAELKFRQWDSKTKSLIQNLTFHDKKQEYKNKEQQYIFKYTDKLITWEIGEGKNITNVSAPDWDSAIEFTDFGKLPQKELYVGIYTDTVFGEKKEWVATIGGFDIFEFASYGVNQISSLEFDPTTASYIDVIVMNDSRFVVAYRGPSDDGFVEVIDVTTTTGALTTAYALEFDTVQGSANSIVKIDDTHFVIAYYGESGDGYIKTFSMAGDGTVTEIDVLEHDTALAYDNDLIKMADGYYLLAYGRTSTAGYVATFNINSTYHIIEIDELNHGTIDEIFTVTNSLAKVNDTMAIIQYAGSGDDGFISSIVMNSTYHLRANTALEYDSGQGTHPDLIQYNETHYIGAYRDSVNIGRLTGFSLALDTGTMTKLFNSGDNWDSQGSFTKASDILLIDSTHLILAYQGTSNDGFIRTYSFDEDLTGNYNQVEELEHDTLNGAYNSIAKYGRNRYVLAYQGNGGDGFIKTFKLNYPYGDVYDDFDNLTSGTQLDNRSTITGGAYWEDMYLGGNTHEFVGNAAGQLTIEDSPAGVSYVARINTTYDFTDNHSVSVAVMRGLSGANPDRSGIMVRVQDDNSGYAFVIDGTTAKITYKTAGATAHSGATVAACPTFDSTLITYAELSARGNNITAKWETLGGQNVTCSGLDSNIPTGGAPGVVIYSRRGLFDEFSASALGEVASDTTLPTYSAIAVNTTLNATLAKFSVLLADETAVSGYIFGTNNSGSWVNDSFVLTSNWANVTKTLTSTNNTRVGFQWWFNDTSDNLNNTGIQNLLTTAPAPPAGDSCTYSSGVWNLACSDFCNITSNVDVIGNNISIDSTGIINIFSNITNFDHIIKPNSCTIIVHTNKGANLRQ